MLGYIARCIAIGILTVWIISVLAFFVGQLPPGDAVDRHMDSLIMGGLGRYDLEQAEVLRKYMGLDRPMVVRYGMWIANLMQGDLGLSFQVWGAGWTQQRSVKEIIGDRIWTTVALTAFTIVVTWTLAIPVGIYSAVRQHSVGDFLFTFIGFSGLAVPDFLLALVLMYVAYAYFGQTVGGLLSADFKDAAWDWPKAWDMLKHLWIPAAVLGTSGTASLIRIMRNNLLDELGKPYVVTARAKGVVPLEGHHQVPRPGRNQPARQHGGIPLAGTDQRQRYRLRRLESAYARAYLPHGDHAGRRLHVRVYRDDARSAHDYRHPALGHTAGRARPAHQVRGPIASPDPQPYLKVTPALYGDQMSRSCSR